ncbi:MAG TPA: ATP-binding protein [Candidatus Binatus sp.]|uniref:sensor histidine kinase n=1 Tax=Candidatus Binatus sp. TaxID=2811406 RepID=UPI002B4A7317|nr:ATP-binding protein [Candidatus Binatus sp.]HKN14993.1 ATP-binding protein [Candidatus Binatus sp.]
MGSPVKKRNRLAVVAPPPPSRGASLSDRIVAIAELGAGTLAAERCAIAFQSGGAGAGDVVYAPPGDSRWDEALNAILVALENRLVDAIAAGGRKRARGAPGSIESIERIALSADEVAPIARLEKISDEYQLAASAFTDGASAVRIAMVARADRDRGELEASVELIARAVFGEMALAAARASLEFWRTHGAKNGREAVGAKRELGRERAAANYLDEAVVAARRAQPGERFRRFGQLVADGAGFDQWVVAVADSGSFIVAASSSGHKQFDLGENSALAESFRRRIVIARWRDRGEGAVAHARQYFEDRIFGGSYVCIPFEAGAIALASRDTRASAARAEGIVERLAPFAASWVLERDAARRSRLVRQLALRMFAAIDEERAKIARDLHDDQAQLLAAAQIALDGPREAARSIFKQVERELRRKTRELRPAMLGNASLDQAIEREFERLDRAGVKAKFFHLIHGATAEKISRPVQQLCFQVVREALSNVIRHARAKSVEITIESNDAVLRVSVADDGCGLSANQGEGIGLAGVRERLELMGGRLTLESHAGGTAVVAEIPESA